MISGENHQEVALTLAKRNMFVDLLTILFGVSSWIGVTSVYLQLPIIIPTAPEGWSLPSYISVTVQSANIGSFAYLLYQKYSPKKLNDGHMILLMLIIGCTAAILMAFLNQNTIEIAGHPHSVTLLLITFMFALVGSVSSVLFMPYMGRFRECYLVTYMLGQELNGFLSSILALIQGVSDAPECIPNNSTDGPGYTKVLPEPPLFGTKTFFMVVFAVLVLGTIAFIFLNNLDVCKREYATGTIADGNEYHYNDTSGEVSENIRNLSSFNHNYLLATIAVFIGIFGNGVYPGLMSFSCLPYGYKPYHLAVTLAAAAHPLGSFVAIFVPHTSIRITKYLVLIGLVISVYIFVVAINSPYPPLLHTTIGPVLIIFSWAAFYALQSYIKTAVVAIFRYQEGQSLVLVGTVSLISSGIGSVIGFLIINCTHIFVSYEPC